MGESKLTTKVEYILTGDGRNNTNAEFRIKTDREGRIKIDIKGSINSQSDHFCRVVEKQQLIRPWKRTYETVVGYIGDKSDALLRLMNRPLHRSSHCRNIF